MIDLINRLREQAAETLKTMQALGLTSDTTPLSKLLTDAADLIEEQQRRLGIYENPFSGVEQETVGAIIMQGMDDIQRRYSAYTVKGSVEIGVICEALDKDGKGLGFRRHRFANLYSAQMHCSGIAEAIANLVNFPLPFAKDNEP